MFIGRTIANTMAQQSTNPSDYQLQLYVDQVMARYDTNRNGTLEANQIVLFFNQLFAQCGIHKRITQAEAISFMRKADRNFDGKANKFELFKAFKAMSTNTAVLGSANNNAYASEWSPNFGGYAQLTPCYNTYAGYGGYTNYNNYGAVGYTTPVIYAGYGW